MRAKKPNLMRGLQGKSSKDSQMPGAACVLQINHKMSLSTVFLILTGKVGSVQKHHKLQGVIQTAFW